MHLILILLAVLISCGQASAEGIEIKNAWIRETPPGTDVAALYMEVVNSGSADRIISIETPVSRTVEFHDTVISDDGTGRMVRLDSPDVPAKGTLSFLPGGKHIMLIGLNELPKKGEAHEVIIVFENTGKKSVMAEVKGFDDGHENHDHGHSHH